MFLLKFLLITAFNVKILGDRRVIHGKFGSSGQFPYQVSLRLHNISSHNCGGSIISKKFILTAAHCLYNHGKTIHQAYAVVGTKSLHTGGKYHKFESVVYHSEYNQKWVRNDIGLIKVYSSIRFNNVTKPIPLLTSEIPAYSKLTLSGWGYTSYLVKKRRPENIMYAVLLSMPQKYCEFYYRKGFITDKHICTFNCHGQGSCKGDSGGPLEYRGLQAGVTSFGIPCVAGYPDVFTKVSAYIEWIQRTITQLSKKKINKESTSIVKQLLKTFN